MLWKAITGAVSTIFTGWMDVKKAKYKSEENKYLAEVKVEGDYDQTALKQMQYSWKDEMIAIIWYSPLYIGWFEKGEEGWTLITASQWVDFAARLPYWWQFGAFGIMAATFGLRWYFKRQNFVVPQATTQGSE